MFGNRYHINGIPTVHQARRYKMVYELAETCSGQALDYGCGYGDVTFRLASRFDHIIGVDPQYERVEFARTEYPHLDFACCPKCGTQFSDGAFDTVFSTMVINWVDEPKEYLGEIARMLRPGGKLIISAKAPDRINSFFSQFRRNAWSEKHQHNFTVDQLCEMLINQGFRIEDTKCYWDSLDETGLNWKRMCSELIYSAARIRNNCSFAPYFGVRALKPWT